MGRPKGRLKGRVFDSHRDASGTERRAVLYMQLRASRSRFVRKSPLTHEATSDDTVTDKRGKRRWRPRPAREHSAARRPVSLLVLRRREPPVRFHRKSIHPFGFARACGLAQVAGADNLYSAPERSSCNCKQSSRRQLTTVAAAVTETTTADCGENYH